MQAAVNMPLQDTFRWLTAASRLMFHYMLPVIRSEEEPGMLKTDGRVPINFGKKVMGKTF
jgi:hypothetical protein